MVSYNQLYSRGRLPDKQELIDALLEIVAEKLEGLPGVPDLESRRSRSISTCPPRDISCVKALLAEEPDHIYRFQPDFPDANAPERMSSTQLVEDWKHADRDRKKDHGSFPEIRKRNASDPFAECTLRCTCNSCNEGSPVDLQCRPLPFGHRTSTQDRIPVHDFEFRGQMWAVALGTWESPEEYRLWGAWKKDPKQTGYNEWIVLRELDVSETMSSMRPAQTAGVLSDEHASQPRRKRPRMNLDHSLKEHDLEELPNRTKKRRCARGDKSRQIKSSSRQFTHGNDAHRQSLALRGVQETGMDPTPQFTSAGVPGVSLDSSKSSPLQTSNIQSPNPRSQQLQDAYETIKSHVVAQADTDGFTTIATNKDILDCLKALQAHARKGDDELFEMVHQTLQNELAIIGLPALQRM